MNMINKTVIIFVIVVMVSAQHMNGMDIRKFGLELRCNTQDDQGNTFWHIVADQSNVFQKWHEIEYSINCFANDNKGYLPNPFIQNNNGKTARQEAKKIFKTSGNVVSGALMVYLEESEKLFLKKVASK